MNPRIRLVLLVAMPAVLALAGGFLVLGRAQPSSSAAATPLIKPLHPVKHRARKRARPTVAPKPKRAVAKARKAPRKAPAVIDGMPADVARALAAYDVAVVALVQPGGRVDEIAVKEARAGAKLAGAGFAEVNVLKNAPAGALTTMLASASSPADRVLDAPAVLIFQRPKTLFVRLNGYVDAETIAQAASNAAPTPTATAKPVAPDWATLANAACERIRSRIAGAAMPQSPAEFLNWVDGVRIAVKSGLDEIRVLKPPKGTQSRVAQMLQAYDGMLTALDATMTAAKKGDRAAYRKFAKQTKELGKRGDSLAAGLGATSCGSPAA